MNQTDQHKMLPYIEIDSQTPAKDQLAPAVAQAKAASETRETWDAKYAQCLEVERQNREKAEYARVRIDELTPSLRTKRAKYQHEILELRDACDACGLAQDIRKDEDTLGLLSSAYAELVEVQDGLDRLKTAETLVALNHAKAAEADGWRWSCIFNP